MKRIVFVLCVIVMLLIIEDYSLAERSITVNIGVREEYNDNIFLTKSNRKDDFITRISPSVALRYSRRSLDMSLDYGLNFKFYSRNSNRNETSLKDIQTVRFQSQFRPASRVFIDISDVYERVPIDIRRQIAFENIFVNLTDKNVFSVSPYVEYLISSTLLTRFGYRFTDIWYEAEEGNDSNSHSVFLLFEKKLSSRLATALKYDYLIQRIQRVDDYDRHQGSISATYQKGSNFIFRGEVGEAFFNYSIRNNKTISFWNVGADYMPGEGKNTTIGAGYGSFFYDSVTEGVYKTKRLDLWVKMKRYIEMSVNPYYSIDKYLETDRKDEITGVVVTLNKPLSQKTAFSISGLLEGQEFLPKGEKVDRYSVSNSLDYKLSPRLIFNVGYTHNNRDSNIDTDTSDFHNNVIWLQSKANF